MKTEHGLTRRLGRELVLQAAYISLAVLIGVFAAAKLVENVLIEAALQGEADYYWQREQAQPGGPLPDTLNMTGFRAGFGPGVPAELAGLPDGYHRQDEPRETLTLVSSRGGEKLYLVFEVEQVDRLVATFGLLPLALVLIVLYIALYRAYRVSRRAVSPVVSLAQEVRQLDPARPDGFRLLGGPEPGADQEIRVLAEALQGLIDRVTDYTERERHFTRDASHELRTPLTVIKIAVDRLLKDEKLPADKRETLDRIRNSAQDMERLTSAFLLLARESDQGLVRDWVCVNDVIAVELDRARIINPDKAIEVNVEESCRLRVLAPEKVLESVVGNLMRNALAYTDEGRVTIRVEPASITIEDTGPGMEEATVQQAFQPFFRGRRQRGGFGVGLTIVKRLTDRFGWPLDITSDPGRGTRVTVDFPEARAKPLPDEE